MNKLEIAVGDAVKFETEDHGLLVKYGTIMKVHKTKFTIQTEAGDIYIVPKKNVWWD